MDTSKIDKVSISSKDGILSCTTTVVTLADTKPQFAFYIFRNQERVHVEWYTENPTFEFDTKGVPGCYWVSGFVKFDETKKDKVDSKKLFINPLEVSPESFPKADPTAVSYVLKGRHWDFPALYYPSDKKSLFVLMPSAVDREKSSLPAFHRWTWAASGFFPANVLCISDPTLALHDDLKLGWLLGNKENCATTELAEFIVNLAESKGIPKDRIVIYGSSAGGFAALAMSACIDGSVAVAINPQVDAIAYCVTTQVDLVSETCFGMPKEDVRREFANRVDMTTKWAGVKSSKAFFVQNTTDGHHYNKHFRPIWKALGGDPDQEGISYSGRHIAWVYSQDGGHIPETQEMAHKIIEILDLQ